MKMDDSTKQKLLAYMEKKQSQGNTNLGQEYSQTQDIMAWMSGDIQTKASSKNITNEGKEKILSGEFFLSIYKQILGNGLNLILEDNSVISSEDIEILKNTDDLGVLLTKLVMIGMMDSLASEKIIKSFVASYVGKCLELGVSPDEYVAALIMN